METYTSCCLNIKLEFKEVIMSNLEIGKRIRTLRTEKGLSREAFVEMKKNLLFVSWGELKREITCPA